MGPKKHDGLILTVLVFFIFGLTSSKKIKFTIGVASSICGVMQNFKDTRKLYEEPLDKPPMDVTYQVGCDTVDWTPCSSGDSSCRSSFKLNSCEDEEPEKTNRIAGGKPANQKNKAEYPWDVHLRVIYDWGKFFQGDHSSNSIPGMKQSSSCTGLIYSRNVILTNAFCLKDGIEVMHTRNRYVLWLVRGKFRHWRMLFNKDYPVNEFKDKPDFKNCDIYFHSHYTDHQHYTQGHVGIIKLDKEIPFTDKKLFRAIELPPPDMTFIGPADFAGWGRTTAKSAHEGLNWESPVDLQKIDIKILPDEPNCKGEIKSSAYVKYNGQKRLFCGDLKNRDNQGLCPGDSGGALVCRNGKKVYACGMAATVYLEWKGIPCTGKADGNTKLVNIPVFYKMALESDWIKQMVGLQNEKDLYRV